MHFPLLSPLHLVLLGDAYFHFKYAYNYLLAFFLFPQDQATAMIKKVCVWIL